MTGRKHDVLIEDYFIEDSRTGVRHKKNDEFIVWADVGLEKVIEAVEGVTYATSIINSKYYVHVDHRYDTEYVKREIEAAILCRGEK